MPMVLFLLFSLVKGHLELYPYPNADTGEKTQTTQQSGNCQTI